MRFKRNFYQIWYVDHTFTKDIRIYKSYIQKSALLDQSQHYFTSWKEIVASIITPFTCNKNLINKIK